MDFKKVLEKEIESKKVIIHYYKVGWISLVIITILLYLGILWRTFFLNQRLKDYIDLFAAVNISIVIFLILCHQLKLFLEINLHHSLIRHSLLTGISLLILNLFFFGSYSAIFFVTILLGAGTAWLLEKKIFNKLP